MMFGLNRVRTLEQRIAQLEAKLAAGGRVSGDEAHSTTAAQGVCSQGSGGAESAASPGAPSVSAGGERQAKGSDEPGPAPVAVNAPGIVVAVATASTTTPTTVSAATGPSVVPTSRSGTDRAPVTLGEIRRRSARRYGEAG
jgi:hypothetical protein